MPSNTLLNLSSGGLQTPDQPYPYESAPYTGVPGQGGTGVPAGMDPREFFLRQTPGYGFAFNEGMRGIQSSAAARGTLLTGGTLRGLARYGTGLADQLYGNTINRYLSAADLGLRAATAPF